MQVEPGESSKLRKMKLWWGHEGREQLNGLGEDLYPTSSNLLRSRFSNDFVSILCQRGPSSGASHGQKTNTVQCWQSSPSHHMIPHADLYPVPTGISYKYSRRNFFGRALDSSQCCSGNLEHSARR